MPEELEPQIRECGLYRNKAKNIIAACRAIAEEHGGKVPSTRAELMALPGVGQKTAGVVLAGRLWRRPDPRGHPRASASPTASALPTPPRPDGVEKQLQAILSAGGMVARAPPAHLARPPHLPRARPGMRPLPVCKAELCENGA